MNQPAKTDSLEELRLKLLKICHKYEDKDFMAVHGKCDLDLAAPRCAKRVRELEALIKAKQGATMSDLWNEEPDEYYGGDDPTDGVFEGWNKAMEEATMNLPKRLEELVHDISSIRAGKTFAPSHYIDPALTAIEQDIDEILGENEYGNIGYVGEEMVDETTEEMHYRNQLRQELRTKLHKYIRGSQDD